MITFSKLPAESASDVKRGGGWRHLRRAYDAAELGSLVGMVLADNISHEAGWENTVVAAAAGLADAQPPIPQPERDVFIDAARDAARLVIRG